MTKVNKPRRNKNALERLKECRSQRAKLTWLIRKIKVELLPRELQIKSRHRSSLTPKK